MKERAGRRGILVPIACGLLLVLSGLEPGGARGLATAGQTAVVQSQRPTFRDIAPIISQHCLSCHQPGGPAPFSLVGFDAVKRRARLISDVVGRRIMPPWLAESDDFADSRRLPESDVRRIQQWVDAGAPEGAPLVQTPIAAPDGWELGPPDLVAAMPAAFALPGDGADRFRTFVLPLPVSGRRFIRAWELRAEGITVLHHATMLLDRTTASRQRDAEDASLPGYEGLVPFSAQNPVGYFLGWTPGQRAQRSPPDMAWSVDPGADLVVMAHLVPNGRTENVRISVALYFADEAPRKQPVMLTLSKSDIDIAAGERRYVATDSYTVPVDVDVLSLQPHAHLLARRMLATATRPDGETLRLLEIRNWDFRWQEVYRFARPVPLPAGTRLSMEYVYDNSSDNPRNPHVPPRRVTYGQFTANEMGDLSIQVVPRDQRDVPSLTRSAEAALLPKTIRGYEMMTKDHPDSASLHDDLALLYLAQGDAVKSAEQFRESLRLRPDAAQAHYNMGMALLRLNDRAGARTAFNESVRLNGSYGNGHYGLALVLQQEGRLPDALAETREAVRLLPADAEVSATLAAILHQLCDERSAIAEYRRSLALGPSRQALVGLALVLATSDDAATRKPGEAQELIRQARSLGDLGEATVLDLQATATAAEGRFDEAVALADRALARAESDAERQAIRSRRALFASGRRLPSGCPSQ